MAFNRHLFSAAIQSRMLEGKLSVRDAAAQAGVSASTISRMTNEEYLPDIESFVLLVTWLEMDPVVFLQTPTEHSKKREQWTRLYADLRELEVPKELIEAVMVILRLVVEKKGDAT